MVRCRAAEIRRHIIEMVTEAGSGHPGGSLSATDIISLLYFHVMQVNPENPGWEGRDRFVLAKGHAAPALYAALALRGFFPSENLGTLRKLGSMLQGHPDARSTPGVEASTGSLGQGLSIAVGMALAGKLDEADYGVYALLGDGEMQEGQVWEAAMAAPHYRLDNLVALVDCNGLQIDGPVLDVMSPEPILDKWSAFGWMTQEVKGHDLVALDEAVRRAQASERPAVIVAHTVKGKGVSYMENEVDWHGKAPSKDLARRALAEIDALLEGECYE